MGTRRSAISLSTKNEHSMELDKVGFRAITDPTRGIQNGSSTVERNN